jgi:hypothetical protein
MSCVVAAGCPDDSTALYGEHARWPVLDFYSMHAKLGRALHAEVCLPSPALMFSISFHLLDGCVCVHGYGFAPLPRSHACGFRGILQILGICPVPPIDLSALNDR